MTSIPARRSRWARLLLLMVGLLVGAGLGGTAAFYWLFLRDLPDPHSVAEYRPPLATTVLDRQGRMIGEFYTERRRLVPFEEVPKHVIDAFVSAEDSSFFEHQGIDFPSIARAAWRNFIAGGKVEGASTITQQMVKGLLLSPERTYTRKIREMILARRIEQRFTKQEILYLYLNQIYFGHGAYGIGEAARTYFSKPVSELTLSEGAQLAGLPKAPSRYSPFANPKLAERRRRYVLDRMLDEGAIDAATHDQAIAEPPVLVDGSNPDDFATAAYFVEEVRRYLFRELGGQAVLEGGLTVETTLDLDLQRAAVAAMHEGLESLDHRNGYRGPLRRAPAGELEAEIGRVAAENGLAHPETGEDAPVTAEEEAVLGEEPSEGEVVASPEPADVLAAALEAGSLLGVVTAVDAEAGTAQVALAPDLRGVVSLADSKWARPMDPGSYPYEVDRIGRIFSVGDVARFEIEAPAPEGEDEKAAAESTDAPPPLHLVLFQEPKAEGALLSLDIASGDILAMVGGYDFQRSQFNRATQARRQPGSAFKPFVYGTALTLQSDTGQPRYTPASIVHDRPKVYTDRSTGFIWKPKNYEREFYGPITLRKALAKSVNNAAIQLSDEVGIGNVIAFARRLGVRSPLEPSLATALGTNGISLLELTRSYAVFPNGGRRVQPRFLSRVLDPNGNAMIENVPLGDPIEEEMTEEPALPNGPRDAFAPSDEDGGTDQETASNEPEEPAADSDRLMTPEQAYLITDMLRAVVLEGTGSRARVLGRPLGGKTGTTNDQADAWFVGFSPEIATGVWVGFDEVRYLGKGETGARAALPVWIDFMRAALDGKPVRDFAVPDSNGLVWARIDRETGLLASPDSRSTIFQPFIAGSEPTRTAAAARETDRARQNLREDSFANDAALRLQMDPF